MCRFSTSMVQRWWDTSWFILEKHKTWWVHKNKKGYFFPPSDSINKCQLQSRAGMMGSGNTDTVALSSLSEQNMEVKQRSEASETRHLKKPNPKTLNLSFFFFLIAQGEQHHHFLTASRETGLHPQVCWALPHIIWGTESPWVMQVFFSFFFFSLGHNLIFLSEFAEHVI